MDSIDNIDHIHNTEENILTATDSYKFVRNAKKYSVHIVKAPKWFVDYCKQKSPIGLTVTIKGVRNTHTYQVTKEIKGLERWHTYRDIELNDDLGIAVKD